MGELELMGWMEIKFLSFAFEFDFVMFARMQIYGKIYFHPSKVSLDVFLINF